MAIVTPHTSQAGIATANGGGGGQYRSLDAFVTPGMRSNAQGLDALARGLDKFGGAVFKLGIDRMQQQNAADLLADKQAEEDAFRAFDSDFREKNKGENALSAPDAYNQFFQDRMNGLKGKWGGNKNLMNAAESMFNSIRKGGMDRAVQYRDTEQEKFVLGVGKAEEARTLLSISDPATPPDERERLMRDYENSARMLARGRNIDADLLAFRVEARRQAKSAVMNQILERLEAGDLAGAEALRKQYAKTGISGQSGAEYAAQRESGKDGSLAIAYDRNGGTSYGKFQIASKPGTMDDFIKWLGGNGGEEAAAALKAAGNANTGGKDGKMPQTWRELVQSGKITDAMQEKFIYDTHVAPVLKGLPKGLKDLAQGDATFDRVLWSTANQHGPGGAKRLISEAWGKSGGDMRTFYQNLYEARAGDFGSSTAEVRKSVLNRLRGELSDAMDPANDITNRPLFDAGDVQKLDGTIETYSADGKAKAYMARVEAGEDVYKVKQDILGLPPKERGAVNSQFDAYLKVFKMQQVEQIQDGVIDLREKMPGMSLGDQYKLVHELPEATEAQRKVKKQALADYAYYSAHAGLVRTTNPEAYNELLDKIIYGDISGPDAVKQLKSDPLAVKVAQKDIDKLAKDLEGASVITDKALKEGFLFAIGKNGEPYAKTLNADQKKEQMQFIEWGRDQARNSNRANEPGYAKELGKQWRMSGESKAKSGFGYGRDMTYGQGGMDDPSWLPVIPAEDKQRIDDSFNLDPERAKKLAAAWGNDIELAKRALYRSVLAVETGKRQRPKKADM